MTALAKRRTSSLSPASAKASTAADAGNNDDGLRERAGDKILHYIERVVPRQDWLVGGPTAPRREQSCGCAANGREKRSGRM